MTWISSDRVATVRAIRYPRNQAMCPTISSAHCSQRRRVRHRDGSILSDRWRHARGRRETNAIGRHSPRQPSYYHCATRHHRVREAFALSLGRGRADVLSTTFAHSRVVYPGAVFRGVVQRCDRQQALCVWAVATHAACRFDEAPPTFRVAIRRTTDCDVVASFRTWRGPCNPLRKQLESTSFAGGAEMATSAGQLTSICCLAIACNVCACYISR